MSQYRIVPTYTEPRQTGQNSSPSWYRFDQAIHLGTPPGAEIPITVTASPFTYQAKIGGFAIIDGGSVTAVRFSRTATSYLTGQTKGVFPLSNGDSLTVTYGAKPTFTFVPQ
jgi:hypothetical protein